jgi:amino acid adenylation domain-containing protein
MTPLNSTSLNVLSKKIETIYPLTSVQQGMLFHTLMQPKTGIYLQQYRYIMTMDNLDVAAFERAWNAVVKRHQVLRSAFIHETQDKPLQVVFKDVDVPFQYLDWRSVAHHTQQERIEQLLADERAQGLPFNQAPLMRIALIQLEDNKYQFIRSYHHILMDAWCFSLIMVEFLQFYRAFIKGQSLELPPATQYQDYIAWLNENTHTETERDFWQQNLVGFNEPTSLGISQPNRFATDNVAPNNAKHEPLSKDVIDTFDINQSKQLQSIANTYQVTLNTLLQGAWAQTLAKYSQQKDIVFGITVAGRSIELPNIESIVGLFINTLPLRVNLEKNENLGQWLQTLQQNNLLIRDFEQTSLASIQQWSDVDEQPLFNSIFVYENAPMDKSLDLENLEFSVDNAQNRSNLNYPLTVTVLPREALQVELTYRCSDFDEKSVKAMLTYYKQLLVNLCQFPSIQHITLQDLELSLIQQQAIKSGITPDIKQEIKPELTTLNEHIINEIQFTHALIGEHIDNLPLAPQLFSALANSQPHANAVTFNQETLTYAELNEQSNQLAHYLTSHYDIKPDTLIGLCISPNIDMIVSILAIIKSGAAYVPLDPNYPTKRLAYMIDDAKLDIILSEKSLANHDIFNEFPNQFIAVDCPDLITKLAKHPASSSPDIKIVAEQLAYVIYTSGTSGQPKGVMVEHQQLSNFLTNVKQRYRITPQDKVLQFSTINFDISVEECFGALCLGAELIIRDHSCVSDPVKFFAFCQQQHITVLSLPTAFWHQLVSYPHEKITPSLRLVIVGGEALQLNLVNHWFNHFDGPELVNTYGPTEATVTASGYHLTSSYHETGEIPIGQSNINTQLYILDNTLCAVPYGVIGELYIGGGSIARGYLNKEALTKQRFIQSPFDNTQRLYRTGDLVRLNHNDDLEFNGRIDDQVKIRGYRIELAEVESVIQQQKHIKQCLVIAWQKQNGDKALAAYFTSEHSQCVKTLRQQISKQLAEYMVPATFIELASLPLTNNGKINKKALPHPLSQHENKKNDNNEVANVETYSELEQVIIKCWKTVLDVQHISIHDNFFALGGHSLLVIQVLSALRKQSIIIEAAQLFKTPTPQTLAATIDERSKTQNSSHQDDNIRSITGGLIPQGCKKITGEMLPLLSLAQQQINAIVEKVPQGMGSIQDIYPLAPLQEGILFHHMLSPKNDPYIVRALLEINTAELFEKFVAGLNFVIQRHDILRTSILWRKLDKPVQLVNRKATIHVEWLNFDHTLTRDGDDICAYMKKFHIERANHQCTTEPDVLELDLEDSPLLKLSVAKDPNTGKHAVMFIEHHIISDHISVDIIMSELTAFLANDISALKPSVPYRHFVSHALQYEHNHAKQYFDQVLGHIDYATLPYQLANTQGGANNIAQFTFPLSNELSANIRRLCKEKKSTPANFFHSAWALVVARASAKSEVVFGTVMSGRLQNIEDAEAMLGMFINTLPITVNLTHISASQLLIQTSKSLQALIPHEQSSLAIAQRCSKLSGEQPLFSALINYRHSKKHQQDSSNEVLSGIKLLNVAEPSNYPFTLSVDDFGEKVGQFSVTLEIDKTLNCQQINQELMTAITLLSEQLSQSNNTSILDSYLASEKIAQEKSNTQLNGQLNGQLNTPLCERIEPAQMVYLTTDALPELLPEILPEILPELLSEKASSTKELAKKDLPKTEHEKLLASIWQDLLTINKVKRHDNFFELGGHSLLIMQIITRLQKKGIELSASQVFKTPVLKDLACELNASELNTYELNTTQQQNSNTSNIENHAVTTDYLQGVSAITPEMLPLVDLNQQDIDHIIGRTPNGIPNIQDIYGLAPLQQGILFHHRIDGEQDPYVMPAYLKITGTAQFKQFVAGLNHIIKRHDTLRTAIMWRALSQPVQVVHRNAELPVHWLTLDTTQDLLLQMQALDEKQLLTINIEQAPLLNITVAHDPQHDEYVIRMLDHHIISDHVSMDIVQKELSMIFTGHQETLPKPVQYRGFIEQLLNKQSYQQQQAKQFFSEQLKGFVEPSAPFSLNTKAGIKAGTKVSTTESDTGTDTKSDKEQHKSIIIERDTWLPTQLSHDIREQAKQLKLNPATLFHSAFAMVIAACSNKEDIVFGTVMSGRLQGTTGIENMMGMFINTLPVRINLTKVDAKTLVHKMQTALRALIPYEQTPLADIQQLSDLSAEVPLFNSLFNYRHTAKKTENSLNSLLGLKFIDPKERTNYPFAIAVDDFGDDFLLNVQVEQPLNVDRTTRYMLTALTQLLNALTELSHESNKRDNKNVEILHYSVVPEDEQLALLGLNYHAVDYPSDTCIYELFEQQVQRSGQSTALIYNDMTMSYQVLEEKTNQLAHYLIAQGVKPNDYIALYMDRSFEMVIAIWAILKAGGAYLPIDVDLPQARIATIIEDSHAKILMSQRDLIEQVTLTDNVNIPLCSLDDVQTQRMLNTLSSKAIERSEQQSSLSSAYLIYTSGSTGRPKGVVCSHQGLVNRIDWMQKQYQLTSTDKVLQKTPYNFDVSVWEFMWPLITGATLVIAKPEGHKDTRYLTNIIQQHAISHLHFVPSMLNIMLSDNDWLQCSSVNKVFCSGEALSYDLKQTFFAKQSLNQGSAELHNLYGPTEASIDVSYWQCQPETDVPLVPIGKPIQNTQLLVLDNHLKLAPMGVEGELYIGGVGLAQGYLNQPELTEERFIKHPFTHHSYAPLLSLVPNSVLSPDNSPDNQTNQRLYRTGDLVRLLDDSNIEYLGRLDHQVKIRGLRIELGEIECLLNQHNNIHSAQLTVKYDQRDEPILVAYLQITDIHIKQQIDDHSDVFFSELKQLLTQQLPRYMVPEHYVVVEQWPLSTNGKINKTLLPNPEFVTPCNNLIAPTSKEQSKLVSIWSELLMIPSDQISIDSNFFKLGGHSILAMKLISAIETEFNVPLSLNSLFSAPTIMTIAQQIVQAHTEQNDDVDFMQQLLNEFEEQE